MKELRALIITEAKLLFRDPITWLAAIALPSAVLLIFGSLFPPEPDPALGGQRWLDLFVPSLVVITLGTLGVQTLPIRLATYREKGVLRRLCKHGATVDADDALRGERRVGKKPARVAPTAWCISLRSDQS